MASELKVDKFTGVTTAGSIDVVGEGNSTTTNLQQGLAKAWVNFDGGASGAAARDSFNVSGMTDDGTGEYTVTLSNGFANANYAIPLGVSGFIRHVSINTISTGSFELQTFNNADTKSDGSITIAESLGDLA